MALTEAGFRHWYKYSVSVGSTVHVFFCVTAAQNWKSKRQNSESSIPPQCHDEQLIRGYWRRCMHILLMP